MRDKLRHRLGFIGARGERQRGFENVEFVKGYLEDLPLPDLSGDVVISNCVINLSGDNPRPWPKPRGCSVPAASSPSWT